MTENEKDLNEALKDKATDDVAKEEKENTSKDETVAEEANNEKQIEVENDECRIEELMRGKKELTEKLESVQKQSDEYLDMLKRTMADFENFRKRSTKERETLFDDGFVDSVKTFLPILDNLERAVEASVEKEGSLYEGLQMVVRMYKDTLSKSSVVEIEGVGNKFNPELHNAVMHIEDESLEENVIVDVLQKGYMYKEKVIRHSMVKVAN